MPSLQPEPLEVKPPQPILKAKLLPPPQVFAAPKLIVPRAIHAPREAEVAVPKVDINNFTPAVVKQVSGARPASSSIPVSSAVRPLPQSTRQSRKCKPEASAIRTVSKGRANTTLTWWRQTQALLIYRPEQEQATERAAIRV